MPTTCWNSVRGRVMRATKVDDCGAPVIGACSVVTSDGFISVAISPEIAEGEEIEVRKADGTLCISDKSCSELKWLGVEITLCQVDPDLLAFLTGYDLVLDFAGDTVGNRVGGDISCDAGTALELWSDIPGQVCSLTGAKKYGYFVMPWLVDAVIGDFTIENDALSMVINARTRAGSNWGVGPHDVDPVNVANLAGPLLTPFGDDQHMDLHVTTVAPPVVACGCTALAP